MRKIIAILLVAVMVSTVLVACGGDNNSPERTPRPESSDSNGGATDRKQEYIEALTEFRTLALAIGAEAESLSGLTRDVWNDAIREENKPHTNVFTIKLSAEYDWNEMWDIEVGPIEPYTADEIARISVFSRVGWNDFNEALDLMRINPRIIARKNLIESGKSEVSTLYWNLGSAPEDFARAQTAVDAMYDAFDALVQLAINPTGSFNSYSDGRRIAVDDFMRNYRLLGEIIDTFGNE
jgi:hypothetical protein